MPVQYQHLLGKTYVAGAVHCWTLVRDFYADNYGIDLGNYAVPHDWDADQLNLIEMIHERENFFKVQDWTLKTLRPGDLLCVSAMSSNANHFCIYLGENLILHHPLAKLSCVETLRDFWRMNTCYVLRHRDVPFEEVVLPDTTIQDLINDRYRVQTEA